ncbi:MAG: hypothetical protein KDN22_01645 [Verrucomicrobiae bacterium]|nr:hypothetical protein [Verrucomicrobiae bacterium]
MKSPALLLRLVVAPVSVAISPHASAQFSSGSNGSFGPLVVPYNTTLTVAVPPDGILHCTTFHVGEFAHLNFTKNAANTPIYILCTGDADLIGWIHLNGSDGSLAQPGEGGPGGYDGGHGTIAGESLAGWGAGPGGGKPGSDVADASNFVGAGSYATKRTSGTANEQLNHGATYGSALLIPLVGGSGGGGTLQGNGGGGGGGAMLVASDTRISCTKVGERGGWLVHGGKGASGNHGSGGAVRLVAPVVTFASSPLFLLSRTDLPDVAAWPNATGLGRLRVDTLDARGLLGQTGEVYGVFSIGKNMTVFPPNMPKLEITEAAGKTVNPAQSVTISLPSGAAISQSVKVRASNFGATAKLKVVLTPERGDRISYDLDIANPGPGSAEGTATVQFPGNMLTRIDVWTR